jgi:hypothetical protein
MTCSLRVGDAQKQKPRGGRVSPKPERENLERADADIFLSCGKTVYIYISIYLYLYLYIYIYDAILLIYFQAEARKPLRLKIDFSKPPGGASSPNIQIGWRWLEPP